MVSKQTNQTVIDEPPSMCKDQSIVGNIVLAEDDFEMRTLLAYELMKKHFRVVECSTGAELLEILASCLFLDNDIDFHIDLIVSDILMPGFTGIEILEGLFQYKNAPPIILITAFGDEEIHEKAMKFGARAIFDKPFPLDELVNKVIKVLS